ncbi:Hypothetical predicted protein [Olea europaea subsp. europaea]|uniref:Uncharacterized protein n=1 Tax=Olea europaea subsp. europaea TaxID=158383 RepID=A0A8S0UK01_OLEEU|nr:Hypothetical predicted protein [Olea europaea subsp. europaea]
MDRGLAAECLDASSIKRVMPEIFPDVLARFFKHSVSFPTRAIFEISFFKLPFLVGMEKIVDCTFFVTDLLRGRLLLADVIEPDSAIICLSASFCKRIQPEMAKIGAHPFRLGLYLSHWTVLKTSVSRPHLLDGMEKVVDHSFVKLVPLVH